MTDTSKQGPKVGDILVHSGGYEQTNVDFYQVVRLTKTQVVLKSILKRLVDSESQYDDLVVPVPNDDTPKKTLRRKWTLESDMEGGGTGYWVCISSFMAAGLWGGKPMRQTNWRYHR